MGLIMVNPEHAGTKAISVESTGVEQFNGGDGLREDIVARYSGW